MNNSMRLVRPEFGFERVTVELWVNDKRYYAITHALDVMPSLIQQRITGESLTIWF